jgi:hypothetical protein
MRMTNATGTGDSLENTESAATGSRRRVAFWVAGATLTLFPCGASAPSPLYAIYQAKLGFSAAVATELTLGASERGTSPDTATGDAPRPINSARGAHLQTLTSQDRFLPFLET